MDIDDGRYIISSILKYLNPRFWHLWCSWQDEDVERKNLDALGIFSAWGRAPRISTNHFRRSLMGGSNSASMSGTALGPLLYNSSLGLQSRDRLFQDTKLWKFWASASYVQQGRSCHAPAQQTS